VWVVALWELATVGCYSVALLLVSSSVFISSVVIQCSIQPRGLDALGASHSAPGAVKVVALWEPATVACYSVALLLVSSSVFVSSAIVQCSIQPRGLNALGASHSAPVAVRVVALWEPATVACFSVALLLVSSRVFILSAVIQCSIQPRGLDALGASHSAPGAVKVAALWEPATVACYSVALLLVSFSVFVSGAIVQCSIQPRGLDALGASHSAPGAVRVVALWELATVRCYSVALLLVSSGVFVSSAVIQCSIKPRGLDALGASHSAPGAVRVVALWEPATVACYSVALLLVSSSVFVSSAIIQCFI
jgi:hypothetical protein